MSLEQTINEDIKAAMIAKDRGSLDALRAIKSAILLLKTEKNAGEITPETELKMLQKLVKQRKEAAEMYKSQNREESYQEEMNQMAVISRYLPAMMSENEIKSKLEELITQNGISGIKEMGKLMGIASKEMAGKADNKVISDIVKQLLS